MLPSLSNLVPPEAAPAAPPAALPEAHPDAPPEAAPESPSSDDRALTRPMGQITRSTGSRLRPEAPVFSFSSVSTSKSDPVMTAVPGRIDVSPRPTKRDAVAPPASPDSATPLSLPAQTKSLADRIEIPVPANVAPALLCTSCEAENPPGYRFCVTCGAPLAKKGNPPAPAPRGAAADAPRLQQQSTAAAGGDPRPVLKGLQDAALRHAPAHLASPAPFRNERVAGDPDAPRAAPGGHPGTKQIHPPLPPIALPPPRSPTSPPPGGGSADKIVGSPVVDIAAIRQTPVRQIECARCHGQCVSGTRFCKYCGAPLEGDRPGLPVRTPVPADRSEGDRPGPVSAERAPTTEREEQREPFAVAREVTTLPSSVETSGAVPRPSQVPLAPLRASYSVRPPAWVPADARSSRTPEGRLVVIVEDGSEGKSFQLAGQQVDIGRSEGDILLEDDLYVSPRHARLTPQNGAWVLRDLGSANRIYLRIRKPHALRDGDLLLLGLEVLQFQTVSDGERGLGHAVQHGTLLFGSPAIHRRARLCQRTVEGVTRDVYHLYRDETVIGRETGDIVFTADPFLSRRHAAVRRNAASGEFSLTDLESSNGTYVAIREDVSLVNRDFVRIGQHLFRVDLS